MDFFKRRSIRKYQEKKIEQETINELMETVLTSPSGRNYKPCEFILIDDKETIAKLNKTGAFFNINSPLVIVVIWNTSSPTGEDDSCIASTIIHLKAYELGLGSCWVQTKDIVDKTGNPCNDNIRKILNIPTEFKINNMISLGYPNEEKPAYTKEDIDKNKLHYNKW